MNGTKPHSNMIRDSQKRGIHDSRMKDVERREPVLFHEPRMSQPDRFRSNAVQVPVVKFLQDAARTFSLQYRSVPPPLTSVNNRQ